MERIEGLPPRYPGLEELRGGVLAHDLDPTLQALSQQAGRELAVPMAAVTLVLERIQLFRGFHGLPAEVEASRATDRDVSFCQFVVRDDAMFEVNDAANDERVPKYLVERYGVSAYLGVPLRIGGKAVGSMCVIDTQPRAFTPENRAALTRCAKAASERLELLALQPSDRVRVLNDRALRPSFAELCNRLQPVLGNIGMMEISLTELAASQRLSRHAAATGQPAALELISRTDEMVSDLAEMLASVQRDIDQIRRGISALERTSLVGSGSGTLDDVVRTAITLAHHSTKLVGGVRLASSSGIALDTERTVAVRTVAAAMNAYAKLMASRVDAPGIEASVHVDDTEAAVSLSAPHVSATAVNDAADQLRVLLEHEAGICVRVREGGLQIAFARVGHQQPVALVG